MNKLFKVVWSASNQAWIVCSELAKNKKMRSTSILISPILFSGLAMADADWHGEQFWNSSAGSIFKSPTDPTVYNMIIADPNYTYPDVSSGSALTVNRGGNNRTYNYIGDLKGEDNYSLLEIAGDNVTVNYQGDVDFTGTSAAETRGRVAVNSLQASTVNFEGNTTINSIYNYPRTNQSGTKYHHGVLAGSSVDEGNDPQNNGKYSTVNFNNLEMHLTDASPGVRVPIGTFGFRAIQGAHNHHSGEGSAGFVNVDGDMTLDIKADRAIGIYVSGNKGNTGNANDTGIGGSLTPKVILNGNSAIILAQSDESADALSTWDSTGIKLGKVRDTGEGPGILESHGALSIDTTETLAGNAIKMSRNSILDAADTNSSTTITTNGYALEIGSHDDMNSSFQYLVAASHNLEASFKDANFTTTGTSADPNIANAEARKDLIFVDQGQVGTKLSFSGDATNLTANPEGYIINVSGNYTAPNYVYYSNTYDDSGAEIEGQDAFEGSSVTFNATDAGSMTGLVSKGSVKTAEGQSLDESKAPTLNLNLSNGFTWNLAKKESEITALFDTATISDNAVINAAYDDAGNNEFVLQGNVVSNGGIINLDNASHGKYTDKLTIDGNYTGNNGSVRMNTVWNAPGDANGADSSSDELHITGTAVGTTSVIPVSTDGSENIIDGNVKQVASVLNTVPVVYVGVSGERAFTGTAQTTGATEVQLAKRTVDGKDEYYWTMTAKSPDEPDNPTPPAPAPDIYYPGVPGYVEMPRVNMEQGYASLGTLHERRGENQVLAWDDCGTCGAKATGQTWGRIYGKQLNQDGKNRLNLDTDIYGFQIGHDFRIKANDNGSHSLTGAYVSYNKANTDFFDDYRAENGEISHDKYTGKGKSDALSLGLTHTYYSEHGSYLDLVGQLSYLHNKYQARDNSKGSQNGWGAAASAEVGRPFALNEHKPGESGWLLEPQAQLIYQYLDLNDFDVGPRHVTVSGQHGLRGRVGVRLARNSEGEDYQTRTFYAVANVWQDFLNPRSVSIGGDNLREKYASTWGEIGIGAQLPIAKRAYVYADGRYEKAFGSTKREGVRGTLGIKYTWN